MTTPSPKASCSRLSNKNEPDLKIRKTEKKTHQIFKTVTKKDCTNLNGIRDLRKLHYTPLNTSIIVSFISQDKRQDISDNAQYLFYVCVYTYLLFFIIINHHGLLYQ